LFACSFTLNSFCNTINEDNPNNVILRGYFSDHLSNGLIFTRLETLRGDEDRAEIKIWDNLPFDCNGEHQRLASFLGNMDEEVIISIPKIDSIIFEGETFNDYRVPEGIWWETHSLKIIDDSITGYIFTSPFEYMNIETIYYDDFIDNVIEDSNCIVTSTNYLTSDKFNIYPSVVSDFINIEYDNNVKAGKVEVYSLSGQKVLTKIISPSLNLGILSRGIYIIAIRTSDGKYYRQKIFKI
jgi:hypothetical protein